MRPPWRTRRASGSAPGCKKATFLDDRGGLRGAVYCMQKTLRDRSRGIGSKRKVWRGLFVCRGSAVEALLPPKLPQRHPPFLSRRPWTWLSRRPRALLRFPRRHRPLRQCILASKRRICPRPKSRKLHPRCSRRRPPLKARLSRKSRRPHPRCSRPLPLRKSQSRRSCRRRTPILASLQLRLGFATSKTSGASKIACPMRSHGTSSTRAILAVWATGTLAHRSPCSSRPSSLQSRLASFRCPRDGELAHSLYTVSKLPPHRLAMCSRLLCY